MRSTLKICRWFFLLPFLGLLSCGPEEKGGDDIADANYDPYHSVPEAKYVGATNCKNCHATAFAEWVQSDHHKAMLPAAAENIAGNFSDVEFEHFGHVTRFFKKGEEFWVNTENAEGKREDMEIEYAFGHFPLQQYLIAFPGGRYQALQVCWDSRTKEEGGQRWFHLYTDEEVPPSDVLHWTRRHFNWNYMCADCHSTNLKKGFDLEKDAYTTTWSEMNVSCEACHGPGSEHVKWGEAERDGEAGELLDYVKSKGLVVTLQEPQVGNWYPDLESGKPKRTSPIASNVQVETCARCHAHRQLMQPDFVAGQGFHNSHSPSVLSDQLYHHDGQIDEEVYVYGSFVQSKMYHAGVRCTDCHNPHTMKLLAPGNALCIRCHQPDKYNTTAHHFHQSESTGASCVECHMPTKNFMVVDARRDHSLRIPRPDLSEKLGTPDACTGCHTDQTVEWAAKVFTKWWGKGPRNAHYGEIFAAARDGVPGSMEKLIALANDMERPGIVRATAMQALGQQSITPEKTQAIINRLADSNPAVRKESLTALLPYPADQRLSMAVDLLNDDTRAVRAEAARILAAASKLMNDTEKANFTKAAREFELMQQTIYDRGGGHMGMGLFYSDLGEDEKAISAYQRAKKAEPEFIPTRISLAELLFEQNRPNEAENEFREAVGAAAMPSEEGLAHDALARFLIRMKRYDEGITELKRATELLPRHAQTQYFYGVALNSMNRFEEALPFLEKAHELDRFNIEYLTGLATICRDARKMEKALHYAKDALKLQPESPQLQQLVRSLGIR